MRPMRSSAEYGGRSVVRRRLTAHPFSYRSAADGSIFWSTGLAVHMNQVHKETLDRVENAIDGRDGLDIEIFGMEGVPEDLLNQHRTKIITDFYSAQEERRAATGNPPAGTQGPAKKLKMETPEELKKRLAEHKARRAMQKANADVASPTQTASPGAFVSAPSMLSAFHHTTRTPLTCRKRRRRSRLLRRHSSMASQASPATRLMALHLCPPGLQATLEAARGCRSGRRTEHTRVRHKEALTRNILHLPVPVCPRHLTTLYREPHRVATILTR